MDISQISCSNEGCLDHGKPGRGNIVRNGRYGKQRTQLFKCRTCGRCFSENRNTPFFKLRTPKETVVTTLRTLAQGSSLRGAARKSGHKRDTIASWMKRARQDAEAFRACLLHDLRLAQSQVDELWGLIVGDKLEGS
jgi:transposase-like protein